MIARYTPGEYNYSWHNAPRRQFIVNLDGDVEVEVSGGEKRVIRRGEVFFVEDTSGQYLCIWVGRGSSSQDHFQLQLEF